MARPLITVVTPAYNAGKTIDETVDSVLAQDYAPFEYIVVDDGSRDDTAMRLSRYGDRVRVIRQENAGEGIAVNRGIAAARGEIVGVVNADDPILPRLLTRVAEVLTQYPEAAGVYPDWLKIDVRGQVIQEMRLGPYDFTRMLAEHLCDIGPGCFYRTSVLGEEPARDPRFRYSGDFHQLLRMGLNYRFVHIPEVLATWRWHAEGASQAARNVEMAANKLAVVEDLFSRADMPQEIRRLRSRAMSSACFCAATIALDDPQVPARALMWQSLRHQAFWPSPRPPERRRTWRLVLFALGTPLTRPLIRFYKGLYPDRFDTPISQIHYSRWRPTLDRA